MEGDIITLQDLFAFDYGAGFDENGKSRARCAPRACGRSSVDKLDHHGVNIDPRLFMLDGPLR